MHIFLNGIEVRGSPHSVKVVDTSSVSVSSDHVKCVPVGQLTSFTIDTRDAGRGDIKCIVTSPTRNSLDVNLLNQGHEVYNAQFIPKEVEEIIASFKNRKAMGPHHLKFELIKYLSREGMNYITVWLNGALECGKIDPYLNTGIDNSSL